RSRVVDRFQMIAALPHLEIKREHTTATTPLLGIGSGALLGQEVFELSQKKGSKLTALGIGGLEIILLQELREEGLGEILGIVRAGHMPPGIGVKRVPVNLAQGGQRSEEHTSELQSRENLVCRLLLEKKKKGEKQ